MNKSTIKPPNHKLISHLIEEGKWPFPVTTDIKCFILAKNKYQNKKILETKEQKTKNKTYPDNSIALL